MTGLAAGLSAAGPSAGALAASVEALAAELLPVSSGSAAEGLTLLRTRLDEPLRVAVVGRVSSGKSTLVNALLSTAVAPTAAGECTAVPCWYRHGRWTTATIHTRDGRSVPLTLLDGRLPVDLPVPLEDVERVAVVMPVPLLRSLTLVDTPGLASGSAVGSARTEEFLARSTVHAANAADALLLVVNGPLKDDEAAAVTTFRARAAHDSLSAGTALAVLTKADQLAAPADTAAVADALAGEMAIAHRALVAAVVPVVGLLGETAAAGRLDERAAADLVALATAWDGETTDLALSDHRLFVQLPGPVGPQARAHLLGLLGLFGLRELLSVAAERPRVGGAELTDVAASRSGVVELSRVLEEVLEARSDVLKASTGLRGLRDLAAVDGAPPDMADRVEALADSDAMFPVRLLDAAAWIATGRVRPPEELLTEVQLASVGGLGQVHRARAAERAAAWRSWRMFADGPGQRTAELMVRAWQLAAAESS